MSQMINPATTSVKIETLYYLLGILAVLGAFLRWAIPAAYRFVRNVDLSARFVQEIGSNHLPHIYHRLDRIDQSLGIIHEDHPNIGFTDGNSQGVSR